MAVCPPCRTSTRRSGSRRSSRSPTCRGRSSTTPRSAATSARTTRRYGFAALAGVELHLAVVADHDPLRTAAAAYLHVPDADALAARVGRRRAHRRAGRHRLRAPRGLAHRPGRQPAPIRLPASVCRVTAEIRWGIVGPGRIAEKRGRRTSRSSTARAPVAVASRSLERARGLRRPARHRARVRLLRRDPRRPRRRRPLPRDAAPAAPRRSRSPRCAPGKALLVEKAFTATTAGARRGRRPGPRDRRLRHGGDVDALPAGRRRAARAGRRRRDRRGALGAGRPRRRRASTTRPTGCSTSRSAAARCSTSASTSSPSPRCCSGRRRAWSPPARCSRPAPTPRPSLLLDYGDGRSATLTDLAAQRAARPGAGLRDDGLDRRPPALPPPARRSCCTAPAPSRRRSPGRRSAPATRTS